MADHYHLKFSVASRTIISKQLTVMHWDAFGTATIDDFRENLPALPDLSWHGYIIHSAECNDIQPGIYSEENYLLYVTQTYPRYLTRFEGSFDDFLGALSSKSRSTLRRKVKKFAKQDQREEPDWRAYQTGDELETFFSLALPLAKRTYQARLFDGALPNSIEFQRNAIHEASAGKLRAYLLFLQGEPVAYLYTPLAKGAYLYEYLGYDEQMASLSPGTVLQYLVHQHLFEEKSATVFDFTEGEGSHKALFATESSQCCTALYLRRTVATSILLHTHRAWDKGVEKLKGLAAEVGGSAKIRKLFRG